MHKLPLLESPAHRVAYVLCNRAYAAGKFPLAVKASQYTYHAFDRVPHSHREQELPSDIVPMLHSTIQRGREQLRHTSSWSRQVCEAHLSISSWEEFDHQQQRCSDCRTLSSPDSSSTIEVTSCEWPWRNCTGSAVTALCSLALAEAATMMYLPSALSKEALLINAPPPLTIAEPDALWQFTLAQRSDTATTDVRRY